MYAAHRLYERLGFVRAPELDWQPVAGLRPPRLHPGALNSVEEPLSIDHHAGHPPRRDQPVRRIDGGYLELQQPAIDETS